MKKIMLLFYSILSILSLIILGANSLHAESNSVMFFHYYRFDNNYEEMNVHTWYKDGNPIGDTSFVLENKNDFIINNLDFSFGGYVASVKVGSYFGNIGFIIKRGPLWNDTDISSDRFCDTKWVEKDSNENYHVYIVQGEVNIGISREDKDNNMPDKRYLRSASIIKSDTYIEDNEQLNTFNEIGLSFDYSISYNYEIKDKNNTVLKSGASSNTNEKISLNNILDIESLYFIEITYPSINNYKERRGITLEKIYDTNEFGKTFNYDGDLGVSFSEQNIYFRLWAPNTLKVKLLIYNSSDYINDLTVVKNLTMLYIGRGVWEYKGAYNELIGKYYTFQIQKPFTEAVEITDPYTYSAGLNGKRGMVIDFESINNELNFVKNNRPSTIKSWTDYIVYELHVRDLTSHSSWGGPQEYSGKFLGLGVNGTTYTENGVTVTTGLDHIKELGVNAIQLLPIFDNAIIDETKLSDPSYNKFNWGYMPQNYNSLEGSYATEQIDASVKVKEFKRTMEQLTSNDLRVIMDVVYNHTGNSYNSNFYQVLPGYYHRMTSEKAFFNGSGCLNETASDRVMMRKFMKDSIKFWATEYNISGFRFDLMGLHDVETMNEIVEMLNEIDPSIVVYGEPWTGGASGLGSSDYKPYKEDDLSTYSANYDHLDVLEAGSFNDKTRDAIKGNPDGVSAGWINGGSSDINKNYIYYGVSGATSTFGVGGSSASVNSHPENPNLIVNYVSAHDNFTLRDKIYRTWKSLYGSAPTDTILSSLSVEASGIVLLSQGISFIHAGEEILRTKIKSGYNNEDSESARDSYDQPDLVNQLRYDEKIKYKDTFLKYKELIDIRKNNDCFRLSTYKDVFQNLGFDYEIGVAWIQSALVYKILDKDNVITFVIISNNGDVDINLGQSSYEVINPLTSEQSGIKEGTFRSYGWHISVLKQTTTTVTFNYGINNEFVSVHNFGKNSILFNNFDASVNGYYFNGWFLDSNLTIPLLSYQASSDLILYASYTREFKVVIHSSSFSKPFIYKDGDNISSSMLNSPSLGENYEFVGWYLDSDLTNSFTDTIIREDIHLYPKYKLTTKIVESIDSDGYTPNYVDYFLYGSENLVKVLKNIKKNLAFMGFYSNEYYEGEKISIIGEDTLYYPKYGIVVTLNMPQGSKEVLLEAEGASIKSINAPTNGKQTFIGYYLDRKYKEKASFDTLIESNMTLYPKYKYIPSIHPLALVGTLVLAVGIVVTSYYLVKVFKKEEK